MHKMIEKFEEADKTCWEEPDKHALVKETRNGVDYYCIYSVKPILMMKLCDDFEYAQRLSKKMIECGARVFDNFEILYKWYSNIKQSNGDPSL